MSVRAHRINKIEWEEATFNLWHDEKLTNFFAEEYGIYETMVEGTGITELPVEALKEAIKKAKKLSLDSETIEALKRDVKWAKENEENYVQYYCF